MVGIDVARAGEVTEADSSKATSHTWRIMSASKQFGIAHTWSFSQGADLLLVKQWCHFVT